MWCDVIGKESKKKSQRQYIEFLLARHKKEKEVNNIDTRCKRKQKRKQH